MNQQLQKKNWTGLLKIQQENNWTQPDNGDGHGKERSPIKDYFWSPLISGWDNNKIMNIKIKNKIYNKFKFHFKSNFSGLTTKNKIEINLKYCQKSKLIINLL